MITILKNTSVLTPKKITSIKATGGTQPYSYAITTNNSGGTINPTTGDYTAGPNFGDDTITVTDSALVPLTATLTITVCPHRQLICSILQRELGLADGRVYLWDQKLMQPKDSGLYIAVGVVSCKPFSNSIKQDASGGSVVQSANFNETISIDIISRGPDAVYKKEEVLMALQSVYARQVQEANSFSIAQLSSQFNNLSTEDGAAIPYRFNITVQIMYSVSKTKTVDYYDDIPNFEVMVDL